MQGPKRVAVTLSPAARVALEARAGAPLCVQLELLFSCMIRKRVAFLDAPHPDAMALTLADRDDNTPPAIEIFFHAVGTRTCALGDQPVPDLETFPLKQVTPFLPRWLSLDHRRGRWTGEFGYVQNRSR